MRRFIVFTSDYYYPQGGFSDYHGSFKRLNKATKAANECVENHGRDWAEVVDVNTMKVVYTTEAN